MTNSYQNELPDPEILLRAAQEEPPQRLLDDYTDTIHELREKNFTFREIAEWLKKFGFNVDHNAVYRAFAKTVSDFRAQAEAEADEKLEKEDSLRNAESCGGLVTISHSPSPEATVPPPDVERIPVGTAGRGAKMAFLRAALTAKGSDRKTQAEIRDIYMRAFPEVKEATAKHSVSWTAMDLKRKGVEVTCLPKKRLDVSKKGL